MAVLFLPVIVLVSLLSSSWLEIPKLARYLQEGPAGAEDAELKPPMIETEFLSGIFRRGNLLELNGIVQKTLGIGDFYKEEGVFITHDNYIVSDEPYTTTDYEVEQTKDFYEFLKENGIHLLYVNEPTKYADDSLFEREFGTETWVNRNADTFLERIREAGVPALDLRACAKEQGMQIEDLFYRTDHHWTTRTGLWAVQQMAAAMNESCGYNIDPSLYDIENYDVKRWENCWLGEQGRKVSQSYVGLDDYERITPKFATDFTFNGKDGNKLQGTFEDFIDESFYDTVTDVYLNGSWHYAYRQKNSINNNVDYGKVLMLTDSYAQVTVPFMALGVHKVDKMLLRTRGSEFSIRDYILKKGYDTVLVCYAEFMIGAHDDPESANYRMFQFN